MQTKKLTDENWVYAYNDYCMYRVKNGICTVMGVAFGDYGLKKGEYKSISTIKESARPDKKIRFAAAAFSGTACIHGYVDTDGIVYLYTDQDNVNYWMYSVSFPTK